MKVKIRGLVFAGFAAAVFAQSAMAVTPPSEANLTDTQVDDLKKTVTSKYYVNENFQERLQGTFANNPNMALEEDANGVTEKAAFIGWNYGQGGENKEWVKLKGSKQVDSNTEYVEIVHKGTDHNVQINTAALARDDTNSSGAEKIAAAGLNNATDLAKNRLTTAKAVYDFVNEELDEMGADIRGNVNYHTEKVAWLDDGFASTNQITNPVTQAQLNLPANAEWKNHIDHWELIVPNARVAGTAQNIIDGGTSNQTDVQTNLTTAKAVYDYAQPGATDTNGAQVGVKSGNTSTWYTLAAGQDGRTLGTTLQDLPYARVYRDNGTGTNAAGVYVDLSHERVMLASAYDGEDTQYKKGINTVTNLIEGNGLALATAGAVKEYVDDMIGGQNIPAMPDACQNPGVHCALVTNYTTTQIGQVGDDDYHAANSGWLEWTVMAQAQ